MIVHFTYDSQRRDWERLSMRLGSAVVEAVFQRNFERCRVMGRAIADALSDLSLLEYKGRAQRRNALDVNRHERAAEHRRRAACDPDGIHNRRATVELMRPAVDPEKKGSRKSGRKREGRKTHSTFFDRSMLEV